MERQPYIAGSAAPKRSLSGYPEQSQKKQAPKRRVDVVVGGNTAKAYSPAHATALRAAKAVLVIIVAFAGIGFGRISLASATVTEALEARDVRNNLEEVRSSINDMQVEQSTLSNPARIKSEAEALGMSSPSVTHVLDLTGDLVMTEENGALSLTGSIAATAAAPASSAGAGRGGAESAAEGVS